MWLAKIIYYSSFLHIIFVYFRNHICRMLLTDNRMIHCKRLFTWVRIIQQIINIFILKKIQNLQIMSNTWTYFIIIDNNNISICHMMGSILNVNSLPNSFEFDDFRQHFSLLHQSKNLYLTYLDNKDLLFIVL